MNYLHKKIKYIRESYVDTLGKLYEYATAAFSKNRLSNMRLCRK